MNDLQKSLSTCLLATAALLVGASPAWAQSGFSVLGGTNVTCTAGVVTGGVGVSPGGAVPFTNTGCTITGGIPPATNAAAAPERTAFLSAYATLRSTPCTQTLTGSLASQNLAPGVYCVDSVAKAGMLTLTGPSNGMWIFLVNGALTGTSFSVAMAGGGQPCNVFWAPSGAATLTTSTFIGNILAGDATNGSITLSGGTLAGRALASVAVTMTGASIIGCAALSGPPAPPACKDKEDDGDDGDKGHHHSDRHNRFESNDEHDGDHGRKGGDR
jgi:hypothetical protein